LPDDPQSEALADCRTTQGADGIGMNVESYEFNLIGEIVPVRSDDDGAVQSFMPQGRYRNAATVPLNRYGSGPFCKFVIPRTYRVPGVYLMVADGHIRYVGECANLSARFNMGYGNISPKNCFKGGQETNCRVNALIYSAVTAGTRLNLWFHQTVAYKAVEAELRSKLKADWNHV
jgi:hypothetical protein